jgi:TatD related DNase
MNSESPVGYLDGHHHLQDPKFDLDRDSIISALRMMNVKGMVVNGTTESDWSRVQTLAASNPSQFWNSFVRREMNRTLHAVGAYFSFSGYFFESREGRTDSERSKRYRTKVYWSKRMHLQCYFRWRKNALHSEPASGSTIPAILWSRTKRSPRCAISLKTNFDNRLRRISCGSSAR